MTLGGMHKSWRSSRTGGSTRSFSGMRPEPCRSRGDWDADVDWRPRRRRSWTASGPAPGPLPRARSPTSREMRSAEALAVRGRDAPRVRRRASQRPVDDSRHACARIAAIAHARGVHRPSNGHADRRDAIDALTGCDRRAGSERRRSAHPASHPTSMARSHAAPRPRPSAALGSVPVSAGVCARP